MKRNNYYCFLFILTLVAACTSSDPKYRKGEPTSNFGYPENKEIEKTFYLLGDGGYSPEGGTSKALVVFKKFIKERDTRGDYAIFLGDNIYPVGMPPKDDPLREQSEYRLDAQLDAVENYNGKVIYIPGNHDWYSERIDGLERQEEYLIEQYGDSLDWSPSTGCGLEIKEISDDIQMIIIDSQWYLEDWDKSPTVNDDCDQIKTREALFTEIESELKKSQNKTTIIAMHHPIFSNGIHGGQYNFNRHLYPSQRKIPVPILGSLAMLIRTTGGISIQDLQNERYKSLSDRLETMVKGRDRVIFVSGHEHTLQYIDHDGIKQIISGSGSKENYVALGTDGLFAFSLQGFAVYDVFKDGSSWVSYYRNQDNEPELMYQKEVFASPKPYELGDYPDSFPQKKTASIYPEEEVEVSGIYRTLWGKRYRKLYGTEVSYNVADFDTLYGGLEPMREGGGHQTVSIRVKDSKDREYNVRRIRKDAVQFLQSVAYKNKPIEDQFRDTAAENLINDFYTSAHPFAFLAIPTLSEAIGLAHTNPEIYYLPKQDNLGEMNENHGDDVYMIEERPEEHWLNNESFGTPNHDIVSTAGMFERIRKDEKYKIDEAAYVKARLFDMLVGDWDRHQDQWRWAENEDEEGNRTFTPIPRDRDQVFSNFDGAFFGTLRSLVGITNQFAVYDKKLSNVEWFNIAAIGLDRSVLQSTGKDTWLAQAKFIKENITDEVIEDAFKKLPPETNGEITEGIIENLKGRRDNIIDIAERYYDYYAKLAIVTGTDKDDFVDITRMPEGKTKVTIYRNKKGKRADIVSDYVYDKAFTKDIWVYALDDDDIITVDGEGDHLIYVRVIGGQNKDVYRIKNKKKLKIYDHKSKPNTIEEGADARFRFTDQYDLNIYDKDKKVFKSTSITPGIGYNPDDGVKLGFKALYTINDFKRNPYTSQHELKAGYYFATDGFDLSYQARFATIIGDYNLQVGAHFTSPNFARNFFGYGNETVNLDDELSLDYNRVKISRVGGDVGLVNATPFGSYFSYKASFETVEIDNIEGRFIDQFIPDNPDGFFDRKYFAGLDALYRYESYDDVLNPTRGMQFDLNLGGKLNTADTDRNYGYFKSYLEFYNSLIPSRKLVLKSHVQTQINIGTDYEFYQAATLGGGSGLRGYRLQRFIGKSAFATGGDIRYSFNQFKTAFLPFQIGVFGGYDIGRVWEKDDTSDVWHDSYGGGIWINSAEAVNGTIHVFNGDEGWRFSFGFGFRF